jgi:drug/metabolite transporter (DMT)-like permease
MAAGAGLALGVLNASFAATSPSSGLYPVGVSRLVALLLLGVTTLVTARDVPSRGEGAIAWAMAAGVADVGATICIALALQRGSLVLVGVLGALFPAVTVLLARAFLAERMGRWQLLGLVLAIAAVALMSTG